MSELGKINNLVKKNELKKHTSLIHCSNSLSLLQRKICNVLLFHAYPALKEREEHKISIKELCNYLGYKGKDSLRLKNGLKALISTIIEWNLINESHMEEDWTASAILACANIKGTVCTYAYSPRLRDLLYSPSMYGRINLSIQANFSSSYGLALYENCIRYRNLSQTKFFQLDLFRKLMGVPDDKYTIFRDFKRRVINKAVEEVNISSDIFIKPNIKKVGRKVEGISFDIMEREKKKKFSSYLCQEDSSDVSTGGHQNMISDDGNLVKFRQELLDVFCLSPTVVNSVLKEYGVDKIREKIELVKSVSKTKKVGNIAGFLIQSLKHDYSISNSSEVFKKEVEQQRRVDERSKKEKEIELEKRKQLYDDYCYKELDGILENFGTDEMEEIKNKFEAYLRNKYQCFVVKGILDDFKKNGFSDRRIKVFFRQFLMEYDPTLLKYEITFEEFIKK